MRGKYPLHRGDAEEGRELRESRRAGVGDRKVFCVRWTHAETMGQVYAIAGGKGGVGKTTTTANLAAAFAAAGYDAIAVDADLAMANLGPMMGVDPGAGPTIHDVLAGEAALEDAIRTTDHGVDVVPGDRSLDGFAAADPAGLRGVVDALREGDYDVVVAVEVRPLHPVFPPRGRLPAVQRVLTSHSCR